MVEIITKNGKEHRMPMREKRRGRILGGGPASNRSSIHKYQLSIRPLYLHADMADAPNDDFRGGTRGLDGDVVERGLGVAGTEQELASVEFNEAHEADVALAHEVEVGFAAAIGVEAVVMAVDEKGGAGQDARVHGEAGIGVGLDDDEAMPTAARSVHVRLEAAEEALFELEHVNEVALGEYGLCGGVERGDERDVLIFAEGGSIGVSGLVGGDEVVNGDLHGAEDGVETLDAESAAVIEEVGDVSLAESSVAREGGPGEFAGVDSLANQAAEGIFEVCNQHGDFLSVAMIV